MQLSRLFFTHRFQRAPSWAGAKRCLPALTTVPAVWLAAAQVQAQTITTSAVAAVPVVVSPVPFGQPLTWLLLTLLLCASVVWLLKRMGVSMGTLRQFMLGGAALLLGATAFWNDAVLALQQQVELQFTQAGGETLDIPLRALESDGVISGFLPVEFTNVTDRPLRVKNITAPAWTACFPAGVPATPVITLSTPASAPCAAGNEVAAGKACWVDTAALCAGAATALQGASPSVLAADAASTNEGADVSGNVLTNDSDADGPLLVSSYVFEGVRHLAGQAASINGVGEFSLQSDGVFNFLAAKPFAAASTKISYSTHTGAVSELVIKVNRTPTAVPDNVTLEQDTSKSFNVLANDTELDGDILTITSYTQGLNGNVSEDGAGNLVYTPTPNFYGSDTFSYTVSDGKGLTAIGTVDVNVTRANHAPETSDLFLTRNAGIDVHDTITATDIDGDTLTFQVTTNPSHGSVNLDPETGAFSYTRGGRSDDAFGVTVSDGLLSATATVTITIEPLCGNGFEEAGEQCDDANIISGDGCSSTCTLESLPARFAGQQTVAQLFQLPQPTKRLRINLMAE